MGELFFKRIFVLFLLICSAVMLSAGVFPASHPLYSGFSSASNGFVFNNVSGLVSVEDTAVYKTGYYSVNGSAWQSFTLSGTAYNGDVNWLSSSSSYVLPAFGAGEHYVIVYSCTYAGGSWDCHDSKWQLVVVNNSVSGFSAANSGFAFNNVSGLVSVSDTAVYRTGYFSVNGAAWVQFNLSGNSYNGNINWLCGSSTYSLPELPSPSSLLSITCNLALPP